MAGFNVNFALSRSLVHSRPMIDTRSPGGPLAPTPYRFGPDRNARQAADAFGFGRQISASTSLESLARIATDTTLDPGYRLRRLASVIGLW
jgi:hypothetical protein